MGLPEIGHFAGLCRSLRETMNQSDDPKKILFVCLGNACRSQLAEALARRRGDGKLKVWSGGVYPLGWIPLEVDRVLSEKGIGLEDQWSKGLEDVPLAEMDLIVKMDSSIVLPLPASFSGRIVSWEVPDPFGRDLEYHRDVRDLIDEKLGALLAEL